MPNNYSDKLVKLRNRKNDIVILEESYGYKGISLENYRSYTKMASESKDVQNYFIEAMRPVDEIYTQNTYREAERVKNQLDKIKEDQSGFEYRYQGSVSNNTHIKAHSDIDILVITNKFFFVMPPLKPKNPYRGNPIDDLMSLRTQCETHLNSAFPQAQVDCSGAKSISLSGGSLKRKIDVVPSNWFDTVKYKETKKEYLRGIMVFDKFEKKRIENTPFYHNHLLDIKDNKTGGNFKKVVRLLKTIKADSDREINLSSYDIVSIAYNIPSDYYLAGDKLLTVLKNVNLYLLELITSPELFRNSLEVPDKSRKIFDAENKINGLKSLQIEVQDLYDELVESYGMGEIYIHYKEFSA